MNRDGYYPSMSTLQLQLDDELVKVLNDLDGPMDEAVRELMVIELYRRELISSGKAAQLLRLPLKDFLQKTGRLGIPFLRMNSQELEDEIQRSKSL